MGHLQQPIQALKHARVTCVSRVTREMGQASLPRHRSSGLILPVRMIRFVFVIVLIASQGALFSAPI